MEISAAMVKELRERSGAGMMECKKALVETSGNVEGALEALRKSGAAKAAKKAGRIAAEGAIVAASNADMAVLRRSHGYRMVVVANDIEVVAKGFADAVTAFEAAPSKPPLPAPAGELPTVGG